MAIFFRTLTRLATLIGLLTAAGCTARPTASLGGGPNPLAAGGHTIAGPTTFTGPGDGSVRIVFNTRHVEGLNLCATATNIGTGRLVSFLGKENGTVRIWEVGLEPGETFTGCAPDATTWFFTCPTDGGNCIYTWRVDQIR